MSRLILSEKPGDFISTILTLTSIVLNYQEWCLLNNVYGVGRLVIPWSMPPVVGSVEIPACSTPIHTMRVATEHRLPPNPSFEAFVDTPESLADASFTVNFEADESCDTRFTITIRRTDADADAGWNCDLHVQWTATSCFRNSITSTTSSLRANSARMIHHNPDPSTRDSHHGDSDVSVAEVVSDDALGFIDIYGEVHGELEYAGDPETTSVESLESDDSAVSVSEGDYRDMSGVVDPSLTSDFATMNGQHRLGHATKNWR